MGAKSYDDLVSNVVTKLGIDRGGKKTTNQSLRSTTFNVQVCINVVRDILLNVCLSGYVGV